MHSDKQTKQKKRERRHILEKVSLKASKEMSLTSPPALGWQVQEVLKDMQTMSEEKTASQ